MSIDKESTGRPQFDASRRTTKVNLSIIVAVGAFFVFAALAMWWFSNR